MYICFLSNVVCVYNMLRDAQCSVCQDRRGDVRLYLLGTGCLFLLSVVRKLTRAELLVKCCIIVCRPEVLIVRE